MAWISFNNQIGLSYLNIGIVQYLDPYCNLERILYFFYFLFNFNLATNDADEIDGDLSIDSLDIWNKRKFILKVVT